MPHDLLQPMILAFVVAIGIVAYELRAALERRSARGACTAACWPPSGAGRRSARCSGPPAGRAVPSPTTPIPTTGHAATDRAARRAVRYPRPPERDPRTRSSAYRLTPAIVSTSWISPASIMASTSSRGVQRSASSSVASGAASPATSPVAT